MAVGAEERKTLFVPKLATLEKIEVLSEREKMFRMRFDDGNALGHQPGQFVEVSVFGVGEAPISVSSSPTRGPAFELGVRNVGNVTSALHRMEAGHTLGIRGPFGNGFPVPELKGRDLLFVAGGIGLCPLRSMIQYAVDSRQDFGRVIILYGCREPAERLFEGELARWRDRPDIEILETVDRCPVDVAWEGSVGVITTLFPQIDIDTTRTTALVVGPPIMYRFVVTECLRKGLSADNILLSLERHMKCGMGLCGHCQIDNVYVCREGPVFSHAELTRLKEAH